MKATKKIKTVYPDQSTRVEFMNSNEYARIELNGSTYSIVDTANQCRFATSSELKAKNYLAKTLKCAGITKAENIDDILSSTEFNEMFDFEAEKKEIESAGWNMTELRNFALSIAKK